MSIHENKLTMTATNIQKKVKIKAEAQLTLSQRRSNNYNRCFAGSSLDREEISEKFKNQVLQSCGCGSQIKINEHNQMAKTFTCKKRYCPSCIKNLAWQRDMALYPSIKKIIDMKVRDPKNNAGLWFTTLTLPTCEWHELPAQLDLIQKSWRKIYKQMKHECNKAYMNAIRKLEINPNPKPNVMPRDKEDYKYHAHLHVLIQGEGNARELRRRWLQMHPKASKAAQDIKKFDAEKGTLVEMLKYLSKPVVEGEDGEKKESSYKSDARRKAMSFIFESLIGRRTIFTYGIIKKPPKFEVIFNKEGKLVYKIGKEYVEVFDGSNERQKKRILNYLQGEKSQASRPLEQTLWRFIDGNYINCESGEKLCEEQDVRAAAEARGEKVLRNYEEEIKARSWRMRQKDKKTGLTIDKVLDKKLDIIRKEQEEKRIEELQYGRKLFAGGFSQYLQQTFLPTLYKAKREENADSWRLDQLHFKDEYHKLLFYKRERIKRPKNPVVRQGVWVLPKSNSPPE